MRVSAEILAMLQPKAQKYQHMGVAFEHLTTEDVVRALAHVTEEGPRLLGRVKFAQQDVFLTPLMNLYWPEALDIAKRHKWIDGNRRVNPERFRALAFYTLHEYVQPPRCKKCKGRGTMRQRLFSVKGHKTDPATDPLQCPHCKGTTYEPLPDASYARAVGISDQSWNENNWRGKQREIRTVLDGWEIACLSEMVDFLDPDYGA